MSNYGIKKEDARFVTTKEKRKEVTSNAFGGSLNVNPIYPVVLSATGIIDNQEVLDNSSRIGSKSLRVLLMLMQLYLRKKLFQ